MNKILVCGLINIETTLQIDSFPIHYSPVRYPFFGIESSVSGVGFNIAKALSVLGDSARFCSVIGGDDAAELVKIALQRNNIDQKYVIQALEKTPQSVILYDRDGKRHINTDLKDIQEARYPGELFRDAVKDCSLAVLCNINFSRPFLEETRKAGVPVATDVHVISSLEDPYNTDYMKHSNILFMSDEHLPCSPGDWIKRVHQKFGNQIVVIGMGSKGALLFVEKDNNISHFPAVPVGDIINTTGAGDALFSCFVHYFSKDANPYEAMQKAVLFASYKTGARSASDGFLEEGALEELYRTHQ
jgi:acarbose 7IV-phosphotransferase